MPFVDEIKTPASPVEGRDGAEGAALLNMSGRSPDSRSFGKQFLQHLIHQIPDHLIVVAPSRLLQKGDGVVSNFQDDPLDHLPADFLGITRWKPVETIDLGESLGAWESFPFSHESQERVHCRLGGWSGFAERYQRCQPDFAVLVIERLYRVHQVLLRT